MSDDQSWQNTGFSQQQWTALQGLLRSIPVQRGAQGIQGRPGDRGDRGPPGNPGEPGPPGLDGVAAVGGNSGVLKADDIGYFDPNCEGEGPVVSVGRHMFYKDIYAFVDRLKDVAADKGEDKVRETLTTCFRGEALTWHSAELTDLEKTLLRTADLSVWCDSLIKRFKERATVAVQHLQTEKYTMADARGSKSPRAYVQSVIRHARAAELTSTFNQLTVAWNNLGLEFRRDIPEPTSSTTLAQFLDQVDVKSNIWFEMARQNRSFNQNQHAERKPSLAKQSGQFNSRQGGFSKPSFPFSPYNQQQSYQGYAPAYENDYGNIYANQSIYQSRQAPGQGPRRSNLPLPTTRPPLRITSGNASGSTNRRQNPSNPRDGNPNGRFERQGRPNVGFFNRSQGRPPRQQGAAYQASGNEEEGSESNLSYDEPGSG